MVALVPAAVERGEVRGHRQPWPNSAALTWGSIRFAAGAIDTGKGHAIEPAAPYQEYGVEDARICRINNVWYMTTCSVSAERHCTTLHVSTMSSRASSLTIGTRT